MLAGGEPPPEHLDLGETMTDNTPTPGWLRARKMAMEREAQRRRN